MANDLILFTGDSITDCGRDRSFPLDLATKPSSQGDGYVRFLSERLSERGYRTLNTGISGNRIYDIETRMERDILEPKPAVVSILAGINDTWRRYDSGVISETNAFKECYRRLLSRIKDQIGAQIIILEPFVLPIPEDRRAWREDLDPKITAVRELAWEFAAAYVPLDGIFAAACCRKPASVWLPDGVHPSREGHFLIAESWINAASTLLLAESKSPSRS